MKKLNLEKYTLKKSKHRYQWQEIAEEMTTWFGRNCYWLFWKFDESIIRTEFGVCKLEGYQDLSHLLFKLNNNHMDKKKIAQRIIDDFKKGKKEDALRSLKMSRGIIGEKAFNYLLEKLK